MFDFFKMRNATRDRTFLAYYNSLSKVCLLSAEEEKQLLERYYKHNDLDARNRVIEGCLRFVVKLAMQVRLATTVDELKQLISAGNEGILVALDKFDMSRGVRFLSYAAYWALLYIRSEYNSFRNVISIPSWYNKLLKKIGDFHSDVLVAEGRPATSDEVCARFQLTEKQLQRLEKINYQGVVSNGSRAAEDVLEAKIADKEQRAMISWVLNCRNKDSPLTRREIFILRAYFGFIDGTSWTLGQIADYLGMSSERVRQIKERALASLKELATLRECETLQCSEATRPLKSRRQL